MKSTNKPIWYFVRVHPLCKEENEFLIRWGGDEFVASPKNYEGAELIMAWEPGAVEMELSTWGKLGVVAVKTTLAELVKETNPLFVEAVNFLNHCNDF